MAQRKAKRAPRPTRTSDREMIAARLKEALRNRDLSIRAFHQRIAETGAPGVSYPAIHRYLAAKATPPVEFLTAAARVLNVRAEWLFTGDAPAEPAEGAAVAKRATRWGRLVAGLELPADVATDVAAMPLLPWRAVNSLARYLGRHEHHPLGLFAYAAAEEMWADWLDAAVTAYGRQHVADWLVAQRATLHALGETFAA